MYNNDRGDSMAKIGIALSGGGIKSFSQLPILATLANENINLSAIAGTSMGSVIGALFATGIPADDVIRISMELEKEINDKKILMRPSSKLLPFSKEKLVAGFVDGKDLEDALQRQLEKIGVHMLSDVTIPLVIPSVDLITGKTILFVSHPELYSKQNEDEIVISDIELAKAVRASCSFPFVIAAMEYQDMLLVDGGVTQNLPLSALKGYEVDKTIAVTMFGTDEFKDTGSLLGVASRVLDIMQREFDRENGSKADVHINIPLDKVWTFEIGKGQQTIDLGAKEVQGYVQDLKQLSKEKSWWEKLWR